MPTATAVASSASERSLRHRDESEMTVAPGEGRIAPQDAEDVDVRDGPERLPEALLVGIRSDSIEDDAPDRNGLRPGGVTVDEGRDRLAHGGGVDDEDHGRVRHRSHRRRAGDGEGRRWCPWPPAGVLVGAADDVEGTVEEAHDALDDEEVAAVLCSSGHGREEGRWAEEAVEVPGGVPGG
jgi:hypothetical protein